ncbi:MAG: hypothetical protein CBC09_04745 [Cellvibrionales bacterium TMED49]|nr:hypothetical protein [Porticoccaceae bacterium]OUU38698.1 MAG: hypothetical protein CBC09_04745 [Cellvibrionales bacterium TMED49]|tara:strand:+ start:549 stop:776 length:228 start_codon:yes stop_codon:yes gene_type:complete
MEPLDPNKKPRVPKLASNHLGLWFDDLEEALRWFQKAVVRLASGVILEAATGCHVCSTHAIGDLDNTKMWRSWLA